MIFELLSEIQNSIIFTEYVPIGRSIGLPCPGIKNNKLTIKLYPLCISYKGNIFEFFRPDCVIEFELPSKNLLKYQRFDIQRKTIKVDIGSLKGKDCCVKLYEAWSTALESLECNGASTERLFEDIKKYYDEALNVLGIRDLYIGSETMEDE